jgi:hypothetical protein
MNLWRRAISQCGSCRAGGFARHATHVTNLISFKTRAIRRIRRIFTTRMTRLSPDVVLTVAPDWHSWKHSHMSRQLPELAK